jgi:hypothetical protein
MEMRDSFYYAYGRFSGKNGHYSIMAMRVDPIKSAAAGRIMMSGHIGNAFEKAGVPGVKQAYSKNNGWAKVEDMAIIRFRCEVARVGYSAHVGEVHILMYKAGPVFSLDLNIPTGISDSNQLRVYSGPGRILTLDDLHEAKMVKRITDQMVDTVYDPTSEDEGEPYVSGMFEYTQELPAAGREPVLKLMDVRDSATDEVVKAPVFERDTRLRRRIVVPK